MSRETGFLGMMAVCALASVGLIAALHAQNVAADRRRAADDVGNPDQPNPLRGWSDRDLFPSIADGVVGQAANGMDLLHGRTKLGTWEAAEDAIRGARELARPAVVLANAGGYFEVRPLVLDENVSGYEESSPPFDQTDAGRQSFADPSVLAFTNGGIVVRNPVEYQPPTRDYVGATE